MRTYTFLAASLLLLASCAKQSSVAPEEVLRLTALANQELTSASFDLEASFNTDGGNLGGRVEGVVSAMGALQNGGRQIQLDLRTSGELEGEPATEWTINGGIIVAGEQETYMKIDTLTIDPPSPILSLLGVDQMMGSWIRLPASTVTATSPVTPDPRLLRMQAEIVTVTNDRGIITLDGHEVHHFDVAVDRQKLDDFISQTQTGSGLPASLQDLSVTGEMWIDTQSYVIRRVSWAIRSESGETPVNIDLTLNLRQHNEPVTIVPPADSRPFTAPVIPQMPGIPFPSAN